ncbi:MAG: hypothetical protein Q9227_000039 [Pyrenula ochraceoflavens]
MPSRPLGLEDPEDYADMPGFQVQVRDPVWTIRLHEKPLLKAHKQLPRRQNVPLRHSIKPPPIRTGVQGESRTIWSAEQALKSPKTLAKPNTPAAPLTPPNAPQDISENDESTSPSVETTIPLKRSPRPRTLTPARSRELPTPDATPPRLNVVAQRPSFNAQQSLLSSRAESFKTAREELTSDEETRSISPSQDATQRSLGEQTRIPLPKNQSGTTPTQWPEMPNHFEKAAATYAFKDVRETVAQNPQGDARQVSPRRRAVSGPERQIPVKRTPENTRKKALYELSPKSDYSAKFSAMPHKRLPHRTNNPRDISEPLEKSSQLPQEKEWSFLPDSPDNVDEKVNNWRLSGISTTSTVEAIVVDNPPPARTQKLRHIGKNASLRSASSPVPQINRDSWHSTTSTDSPHRLVHKSRRISNNNRWSQNSDLSRELTVSSTVSRPQPEKIPVVVIPQRKSSLKSSTSSSRRHSLSSTTGRPTTAPDHESGYFDHVPRRGRALSDSIHSRGSSSTHERRARQFPPSVPVRTSSLSAPTSRNNSRSNSINSESLRRERRAAEADVRRTLARMESESPSVQSKSTLLPIQGNVELQPTPPYNAHLVAAPPAPSQTPFSLPSVASNSPGPVEISEATAVNLFAHNNRSLQLIDRRLQPESQAVLRLRGTQKEADILSSEPATPRDSEQIDRPLVLVDSPLRNPRDPPQPPAFKIIPPTPAALNPADENDKELGLRPTTSSGRASMGLRFGSLKRAFSTRRYSDSFIPALTRGLSLKNARNRRVEEDFDDKLHPFWRPRGFWDDFSDSDSEHEYEDEEDIIVHNSLGIPQKRIIFDGPISLVRRIPNPLAKNRQLHRRSAIIKRASYGSLSRGGWLPGRRIYTIPGLGYRFQMLRLSEMQEKLRQVRIQRELQRRERRRESLRKKIGPNIISNGDSRFV